MATSAAVDLVDGVEHEERAHPSTPVRSDVAPAERRSLGTGLFLLMIASVQLVWVAALAYGAALALF